MCDYSLAGIPSRLAIDGEELVVHRFPTGSMGLASPCPSPSRWRSEKQTPAVCVPPGALLALRDIPKHLQQQFGIGTNEEVTFVQLSATPYQYRDAVRFNNGREVRLQDLSECLRVRVLDVSLPDDSSFEPVRKGRKGCSSRNVAAAQRRQNAPSLEELCARRAF